MEKLAKVTVTLSAEVEAVKELKDVVSHFSELLKKELGSVVEEKEKPTQGNE